ncbi:hypothetical protein H4R20_005544 [Coemansia guatemalensis]|uniref:Uncharacterized protein n=1 Tax=Coemansia guatemalensis TaxID=2761395 RepID=A0A9W8HPE6_9FUNG|nr:hypothetical protein H4R20_005544 [Coemansia guatemalensis]
MKNLTRTGVVQAAVLLLVLMPLARAFTRTSTDVGTMTRTIETTDDGDAETVTTKVEYTSYIIFMNDQTKVSSFAGIPMTTTDEDGDKSTYLSTAVFGKITESMATIMPSSDSPDDKSDGASDAESDGDASATDSNEAQTEDRSTSIGPIVGGVVGGVVVLAIIGVLGWIYKRKQDRKTQLVEHQREQMQILAMELDGSYKPDKRGEGGPLSEDSIFTEDMVSKYTGGSISRNPPTLLEAYTSSAQPITVGTELTMDSQGHKGMPDGSPLIMNCIMPLRNAKASDNYTDLEWFPLVADEKELMHHSGPSYIEEKELSNVATYIQKPSGQMSLTPVGPAQRKF